MERVPAQPDRVGRAAVSALGQLKGEVRLLVVRLTLQDRGVDGVTRAVLELVHAQAVADDAPGWPEVALRAA